MATQSAKYLSLIICTLLSLLLQPISCLYLNETLLIHIDVSIHVTVPQLLPSATANIQQIVETAFEDSSENPIYSIASILQIESISNSSSCVYTENTFRHQTLLQVLFSTQSQFDTATSKYEYIFANDLDNFVQIFESNIFAQLLSALNTDGLSSDTVFTHSLNMVKGNFLFKYNKNREQESIITDTSGTTETPSTTADSTQRSESTASVFQSFRSSVYYNETNLIILVALICVLVLCCCLSCFWCRVRAMRHSKRRQSMHKQHVQTVHAKRTSRQRARSSEMHVVRDLHRTNVLNVVQNAPPHSAVPSTDPYEWSTTDVGRWLLSIGLQRYCDPLSDINGAKLLKSLNTYRLEHIYGISNSKDLELLMARIEILRLKSSAYQNWRNETGKLYAPKNASENQQKHGKGRHFRQKTQPIYGLNEFRYDPANLADDIDDDEKTDEERTRARTVVNNMESNSNLQRNVHALKAARPLIIRKSQQQTVHNHHLYFLSDDESSDSPQQEGDYEDVEHEDGSMVKRTKSKAIKARKPPKRLRRRASMKRKNESMSISSTLEVGSPKHSLSRHARRNSLHILRPQVDKSVPTKRTQSHQIKRRPGMPVSEKRRKAMARYESSEGTGESETEPVEENTVEIRSSDKSKRSSSSDEDTF